MPTQFSAVGSKKRTGGEILRRQGTGNVITLREAIPTPREIRTPLINQQTIAWPVGSVFVGNVSTNPGTLLGFGTWTAVQSGIWASIGSVDLYIWQRTA